MERDDLIEARTALRALNERLAEDIGARILRATLGVDDDDARKWMARNGDPVQDPNASLELVRELGVRPKPVIEAGLLAQRPGNRLDPLHLAVATTLALLDSLLDGSPRLAH